MKKAKKINNLTFIVFSLLRGQSITRISFNEAIKKINGLKGIGLDIGSGKIAYYRAYPNIKDSNLIALNIVNKWDPDVLADAQAGLPFKKNTFDFVISFNVLEHIFEYDRFFNEAFLSLKPGGTFYATVPFLFPYHADPHDYFRYSKDSLMRIGENAGFNVTVFSLGYGPFSAAFLMLNRLFSRNIFLRVAGVPVALFCISLDTVISKFQPGYQRDYAFGYLMSAKKPVI